MIGILFALDCVVNVCGILFLGILGKWVKPIAPALTAANLSPSIMQPADKIS